jgi:hypothetical protein
MEPNTPETDLVHCIYTSAGTKNFENDEIIAILRRDRLNNEQL